tara:strand:- start:1117 stop:1947 length:831 start_codon:yes stop_codon:yes gene_type:complete
MFAFAFDFETPNLIIVVDEIVENFFRLDFVLNFLQAYRHPDTYEKIIDLKLIALNYLFTWFVIDFLSLFPFDLVLASSLDPQTFKLLRLLRMPRLSKLIDTGRVKKILKAFQGDTTNDKAIVKANLSLYVYRVVRLIIIAFVITFFLGCLWFRISLTQVDIEDPTEAYKNDETTWYTKFKMWEESEYHSLLYAQFMTSIYFSLTVLSTVGYGDYFPISNMEMLTALVVMLGGVAFFSYIMGNLLEIFKNYAAKMGIVDRKGELDHWIISLQRFTNR